jgi:molybdenum cofactor cytidylyltransferase
MRVGAVITAAGMSSRMGEFKPMLRIGSITIIKRIIMTFKQSGVDPIVVITGNQAETLEHHLAKDDVVCLRNPDYADTQMLESVKIGLRYTQDLCDRVLFTPVDVPLFMSSTVEALKATKEAIAIPTCAGIDGHPIILNSEAVSRIVAFEGEGGLKGAMAASGLNVLRIPVNDRGILFDADTPGDYSQLLVWHNAQLVRPKVKIVLAREQEFFGPGSKMLLKLIQKTNSVRTASTQMHISYSKAWKMIAVMEEEMGYPIVLRFQGGASGGRAELTQQGEELLLLYERFEHEALEQVQAAFDKYFRPAPEDDTEAGDDE